MAAASTAVTVDDVRGGDLAASHLLELGQYRLAFICGPLSLSQVKDRLAGFRQAMTRAGADPDQLVVLETSTLNVADGRRAGERLAGIPARRRPTAALCANDLLARGLLQQMVTLRLRVPDDLAIIGYDDIEFAQAAAVPLTSVSQPRHELGRRAAQMVLQEASGDPGHQHRQVVLQPELIPRASTRSLGGR